MREFSVGGNHIAPSSHSADVAIKTWSHFRSPQMAAALISNRACNVPAGCVNSPHKRHVNTTAIRLTGERIEKCDWAVAWLRGALAMKLRNFVSGAFVPMCTFVSAVAARIPFSAMVLTIGWLATSQAFAATFSAFYAFGDSTIDSGWWVGAINGQCDGVTAPCRTGLPGKTALIADGIANGGTGAPVGVGLMSGQIIAAQYGLTATPANQLGGTNYAISGSLAVATGGVGNLNPNPNLPSTAGQISNFRSAR